MVKELPAVVCPTELCLMYFVMGTHGVTGKVVRPLVFKGLGGSVPRMSWPKASCPSLLLYYPCLKESHFFSGLFHIPEHGSMSALKELVIVFLHLSFFLLLFPAEHEATAGCRDAYRGDICFVCFESFIIWVLPTCKTLFWCHIMSQGYPAGREDKEGMTTEVSEGKGEDHRLGHVVLQNRS